MPHHFRTIEAFVQLLEDRAKLAQQRGVLSKTRRARCGWIGEAQTYSDVAHIVRTSNIGIVYPPPEVARDIKCNRADSVCTGGENCKRIGMCYSIERDEDGLPWVVEPNGPRCPDCGQVRGLRVST